MPLANNNVEIINSEFNSDQTYIMFIKILMSRVLLLHVETQVLYRGAIIIEIIIP